MVAKTASCSLDSAMPVQRLFTIEEFYCMARAGILCEDDRVELFEGEVVLMSPIYSPHSACVSVFATWLIEQLGRRAVVRVQDVLHLPPGSQPQPDVLVARFREDRYRSRHPRPEDVLLLIEVSDSSLRYDRGRKLSLYAAAAIAEVWIADLQHGQVLVNRDPQVGRYMQQIVVARGQSLSPLAFPELSLPVNEALG